MKLMQFLETKWNDGKLSDIEVCLWSLDTALSDQLEKY